MPGYVGAQLSIELTNLIPIREYVHGAVTRLVDFARDLRKSGTDIVVEEDLAEIFGRGRVALKLEQEFKAAVQEQQITPLHYGSSVELRHGPGPAMMRGFRESRYLAAILTLSMLSYFHSRDQLATMIATSMTKRLEANVPNAPSDPGIEGIINTLRTCSTESTSFNWSPYSRGIETRLRQEIPGYSYHPNYMHLSPATFLGAMDFLYIAQRFPEDRKITISAEVGCVPLIIWAHHILDLTVAIKPQSSDPIIFGSGDRPHVLVQWRGQYQEEVSPAVQTTVDAVIRLHERDMSVILSVEPDENNRLAISAEERHPLLGYGTHYLERIFNNGMITLPSAPIYEESVKLATALAMRGSQSFGRSMVSHKAFWGENHNNTGSSLRSRPTSIDSWRILRSAKLLFQGLPFDAAGVKSYVELFHNNVLDKSSLPNSFATYTKILEPLPLLSRTDQIIRKIKRLAQLIVLFACVSEVEKCGDLPLIVTDQQHCFFWIVDEGETSTDHLLQPEGVFHGISDLLSSPGSIDPSDVSVFPAMGQFLSLYSDFGWSVFFDTFGNKDPATVIPELVHIQKGTPTNINTLERKPRVRDGTAITKGEGMPPCREFRGLTYIPRAAAKVIRREEWWTTQPKQFEVTLYHHIQGSQEWSEMKKFEYATSYRCMQECIWETFLTPECEHEPFHIHSNNPCVQRNEVKLGPDVAVLIGWDNAQEENERTTIPERILVFLTREDRHARWIAIVRAVGMKGTVGSREIMVRTNSCCDSCALDYVASLPGRWILIL